MSTCGAATMKLKFNLWTEGLIRVGLISYESARYARLWEQENTIYLDLPTKQ
jgi:hypothetical protein